MPPSLPAAVAGLGEELAGLPGVVAVVLGGSRASGTAGSGSDWDLGVYYRKSQRMIDPGDVRRLGYDGQVSEVGAWGPIVNGGAWLTIADLPVDVLFRDLDIVERWLEEGAQGRFEVLTQNGYVVGAPTYLPVGELALCMPISGAVPRPSFPEALAGAAPPRWRGRAEVSLMFAGNYARTGDAVGSVGMLVHAVLCTAHARLVQRREWVLNEKRLVERAELQGVQALLAHAGSTRTELGQTVSSVADALGVDALKIR
jgi:predicted nucleotidyltransferase